MGPPPDPDQMMTMLENPQIQSTLNEALQNPQILDMMIEQNPMLRGMGPGVRQMMQTPEFRRMLTDPEAFRSMTQMQRAMGMGPFGGAGGGQNAFPAPGVTDTTPTNNRDDAGTSPTPNQTNTTGTPQAPFNPFAMFGNPAAAGNANPFASLFTPNPSASPPPATTQGSPPQTNAPNTTQDSRSPPPNPFAGLLNPAMMAQLNQPPNPTNPQQAQNPFANIANNPILQNPQLMQQMLQAMGGGAPGTDSTAPAENANPFGAMFGPGGMAGMGGMGGQGQGAQTQPADTRPPEERYEEQLRQLNEMGFHEFERNVEALRRTGGIVQYAVEYLLMH